MNDRGQLLLVAGIVLAVMFVALALLVNTAIYTDNVATRGGDSAGEALEYQSGLVDAIGGLIDAENADDSHADRDSVRDGVRRGTAVIDNASARNYLRRAVAPRVETDSITEENTTDGVLIRRTESGPIDNWTAGDATGVRGFELELEAETIDTEPLNITLGPTVLFVYEDTTSGNVSVAKDDVSNVICSADASGTVRFDVTEERFGGEPCRFEWPTIDEVSLQNNGSVNGTYELTLEASDTSGYPAEIQTTEAIYSADVELRVDTPELRYGTTVRIAPGEPDA